MMSQAKALSIMRKALAETNTFGIGESRSAVGASRGNWSAIGFYTEGTHALLLRYEDELRDPNPRCP